MVTSQPFEYIIFTLIITNTITLGMKFYGQPDLYTEALDVLNMIFTAVFALEFVLKFAAFRFKVCSNKGVKQINDCNFKILCRITSATRGMLLILSLCWAASSISSTRNWTYEFSISQFIFNSNSKISCWFFFPFLAWHKHYFNQLFPAVPCHAFGQIVESRRRHPHITLDVYEIFPGSTLCRSADRDAFLHLCCHRHAGFLHYVK